MARRHNRVTVIGVDEPGEVESVPITLDGPPLDVDRPHLVAKLQSSILGKSIRRIMVNGEYLGIAMHDGQTLEVYVGTQPCGPDATLAISVNEEDAE